MKMAARSEAIPAEAFIGLREEERLIWTATTRLLKSPPIATASSRRAGAEGRNELSIDALRAVEA